MPLHLDAPRVCVPHPLLSVKQRWGRTGRCWTRSFCIRLDGETKLEHLQNWSIKGKALYCFSCVAVKIAVRCAVMVRFCVCQRRLRRLKMKDLENCSCAGSFFFIVAAKKWRLNFAVVAAVRGNWPSEHWDLHGCSSTQVIVPHAAGMSPPQGCSPEQSRYQACQAPLPCTNKHRSHWKQKEKQNSATTAKWINRILIVAFNLVSSVCSVLWF